MDYQEGVLHARTHTHTEPNVMDENLSWGSGKEKKTIKTDGGKRLEKGCA